MVVRADSRSAVQEGLSLPEPKRIAEIEIEEDHVRYGVDLDVGHKTGFFLDQRDNRRRLGQLAAGRTVFDGMTYTGGFALAAARGGARAVRGMDLDELAIDQARANARRNEFDVSFDHGDVFDALRAYAAGPPDERPQVLVVDPPKWARDRSGLGAALFRYRDLNRLALQAVADDGIIVTSSCSGLVSREAFLDVLKAAALDTRKDVRILHEGGAVPDHPVSAVVPESRYLKCVFLAVGARGSGPGSRETERAPPLPDRRRDA